VGPVQGLGVEGITGGVLKQVITLFPTQKDMGIAASTATAAATTTTTTTAAAAAAIYPNEMEISNRGPLLKSFLDYLIDLWPGQVGVWVGGILGDVVGEGGG